MPTSTPTARVSIRGRYRRSVDLARDVHADAALDGYVVTATARATVARIARALAEDGAGRAWSVIGPYGGGKSAFALFAARLAERRPDAWDRLRDADADLAERLGDALSAPLAAVLVGGQREGLPRALARGLARAAADGPFADALAPVRLDGDALVEALAGDAAPADDAVLDLYARAADAVHAATGGGLFVVVDELGKLLEYAALDPAGGDLFLLQRLAEAAARSHGGPPLLLTTVLHQAFDRYAGRLSAEQREEWRKVQGRFEDVPYAEPVDETLRLLARAIEAPAPSEAARAEVDAVLDAVRLPPTLGRDEARERLAGALPLHPAVALLVGPLFRRMAQNERTLFAFLGSGEPGSFLRVLGDADGEAESGGELDDAPGAYRLHHLFDYLTDALGASLAHGSAGTLWAETQSALLRLPDADTVQVRLLKTIALLNFAGEPAGLTPSPALLRAAVGAPPDAVDAALGALVDARVAVFHERLDAYRVWQGSDFDVAARLAEARASLPAARPLAEMLAEALPPAPLVARRHSYLTGTTRAFRVAYATEDTWRDAVRRFRADGAAPDGGGPSARETDGLVVYVLPEHAEPEAVLDALAVGLPDAAGDEQVLAAVPEGVRALRETVRERLALAHLADTHLDALAGDATARREVATRRRHLDAGVADGFARLVAPGDDGRIPCAWVGPGGPLGRLGAAELQRTLSAACDARYPATPVVWNELVNRSSPSASAMGGLKALLVAMLDEGDCPRLGFEGTPAAYGLYRSIVRELGMHRPADGHAGDDAPADGAWAFFPPSDRHPGARAAWDTLVGRLRAADGDAVPVPELYAALAAPPHGVRDGLWPVFWVAAMRHHARDLALYYDGRFLPDFGLAEVELLLKVPEKFAAQWVALDDARRRLIAAVAPLAGLPDGTADAVPVVVGLIRAARNRPAYTHATARLSDRALAVREALRHATEPATLLFRELPAALGLDPADADGVAAALADALRELDGAYPALLGRVEARVAGALRAAGDTPAERRIDLVGRAQPLPPLTTNTALRAFLVRLLDERLDEDRWLESLGAVLGKRPPSGWVDADEETFTAALGEVARRFHTLGPLASGATQRDRCAVRSVRPSPRPLAPWT